jgi:hypothetical protein
LAATFWLYRYRQLLYVTWLPEAYAVLLLQAETPEQLTAARPV